MNDGEVVLRPIPNYNDSTPIESLTSKGGANVAMPHDDSHLDGAAFLEERTVGLCEPHGSKSLGASAERSTKHNQQIIASIPQFQAWREAANRIKAFAIANLDKLLVEFERNITRAATRSSLPKAWTRPTASCCGSPGRTA